MKEIAKTNDKRMTVREVAGILGVSEDTVLRYTNTLFSQSEIMRIGNGHGGKPQIMLNEAQVTAIKQKMKPTSQLVGAITDLEAANMLLKSAEHFKARFEQEREARIKAETENQELQVKNAELEPKAAFTDLAIQSKDALLMNDAAKILKLGYGNITLFKKLREMGILMADNVPYQEYIGRGYFIVDENPLLIGNNIKITKVTKVTQKGMRWLANKLKKQGELYV